MIRRSHRSPSCRAARRHMPRWPTGMNSVRPQTEQCRVEPLDCVRRSLVPIYVSQHASTMCLWVGRGDLCAASGCVLNLRTAPMSRSPLSCASPAYTTVAGTFDAIPAGCCGRFPDSIGLRVEIRHVHATMRGFKRSFCPDTGVGIANSRRSCPWITTDVSRETFHCRFIRLPEGPSEEKRKILFFYTKEPTQKAHTCAIRALAIRADLDRRPWHRTSPGIQGRPHAGWIVPPRTSLCRCRAAVLGTLPPAPRTRAN